MGDPVTAFLTLPAATLAQVNAPTLAQAYAVDVILADLADDYACARDAATARTCTGRWDGGAYDYRAWGSAAVLFTEWAATRLTSAGVL